MTWLLADTLAIAALLFGLLVCPYCGPFMIRLPRFEALFYDKSEWSCEFPNLVPRSDVIVMAASDHDQFEHFRKACVMFVSIRRDDERTVRFTQSAHVNAMILSNGVDWTGKNISYSHYISARGMVGCTLREGILRQGQHVLFLREQGARGSGNFRLVRDLQASTLFVTPDLEPVVMPAGETPERRILSVFAAHARRQQDDTRRLRIQNRMLELDRAWKLPTGESNPK